MALHSRKLLQFYYEPPDFTDESPLTYSPPPPNITASSSPSPLPKKTIQVSPSNPHVSFDSSMAVTILVLLTALFFLGFFSIYIRRFSGDSNELSRRRRYNYHGTTSSFSSPSDYPRRLARRKGLDPSTVRSLPVYTYIKDTMYQIDCAVCLSEFEEEENVTVIPHCKHVFHKECIDTWLLSHVSCPVCRGTRLFEEKGGGSGVVVLPRERTSEPERRSTVENEETCIEVREEEGTLGVRRSRSCSSLEERATLQRTWSLRLCDSWDM